jgi:hypothetical protein
MVRAGCLRAAWMLKSWLASLLLIPIQSAPCQSEPVDVSIVFAVDTSASVDPAVAQLQREGHAQALEAPEVIAAIRRGFAGCVAISYFEWSAMGAQKQIVPWVRICNASTGQLAARLIRQKASSRGFGRRTSITWAIKHASKLLDGVDAPRKVIDLCANGPNNDGSNIAGARRRAVDQGFVINAIVQLDRRSEPNLLRYFESAVIAGAGSFAVSVNSPDDFTKTLRGKLISEISSVSTVSPR